MWFYDYMILPTTLGFGFVINLVQMGFYWLSWNYIDVTVFFLFSVFFFFFVKPIHWEKCITRLFTKSKEFCRSGPNKVFNNIEYFHWYLINVTGVILEELIEESFENLMSISTVITDLMFIIYNIFKNQITVLKILWRWQVIISLRFVSQQWDIALKLVLDA